MIIIFLDMQKVRLRSDKRKQHTWMIMERDILEFRQLNKKTDKNAGSLSRNKRH